eukprot:TRINITY_DN5600_c0_g1_i2.p1 TRINITY_DN5600_c0_g1~~TRINITY_DN5600_c0_g1_i2.p1  ORF type:complete len:311 (+),score=56.96 TRINITY_DN5600_c0_g1_i2:48-980(+)
MIVTRHHNPSPPPEAENDGESLVDVVYVLQVLKRIVQSQLNLDENSIGFTQDSEAALITDYCLVWDVSSNVNVANFLHQHNIISIVLTSLKEPHTDRLYEVAIGILGNLSTCADICTNALNSSDIFERIMVTCHTNTDPAVLTEVARFLAGVTSPVLNSHHLFWSQQFASDSSCIERAFDITGKTLVDPLLLYMCTALLNMSYGATGVCALLCERGLLEGVGVLLMEQLQRQQGTKVIEHLIRIIEIASEQVPTTQHPFAIPLQAQQALQCVVKSHQELPVAAVVTALAALCNVVVDGRVSAKQLDDGMC